MKLLRVLLLVLGVVFLGVSSPPNDPRRSSPRSRACPGGSPWSPSFPSSWSRRSTRSAGVRFLRDRVPFEGCWRCGSRARLQPEPHDGVAPASHQGMAAAPSRVLDEAVLSVVVAKTTITLAQGLFSCSASSSRGWPGCRTPRCCRNDVAPHARGAGPRRLRGGADARSLRPGQRWLARIGLRLARPTRRPARASIAAS